jgi:Protein of unknown function (DUF3616)
MLLDSRSGFPVVADRPTSSPILRFNAAVLKKDLVKARDNLSAVVLHENHLWLGGDEGTSIDRMTRDASGNFGDHSRFDLKDLLKLPASAKEEIDIEGLDVDGGYLWAIGSHSAKRKKAETDKSPAENLERLGKVEMEGNRFTLGRVPLNANDEPVAKHRSLTAARLEGNARGNLLTDALKKDHHLGRFVPRKSSDDSVDGIPSKDNGFDVEGLAVSGNRVFLGLRGPVLRGWAVVIELRISASSDDVLSLDPIGAAGEPYIKHFLQLDGLGVREMSIRDNDLLILAGPSMDLDGPVFIYRWKKALESKAESLTVREELSKVVTVPFGDKSDHVEGLTIVTRTPLSVLVSYDSPHPSRLDGADGSGVSADIFDVTL